MQLLNQLKKDLNDAIYSYDLAKIQYRHSNAVHVASLKSIVRKAQSAVKLHQGISDHLETMNGGISYYIPFPGKYNLKRMVWQALHKKTYTPLSLTHADNEILRARLQKQSQLSDKITITKAELAGIKLTIRELKQELAQTEDADEIAQTENILLRAQVVKQQVQVDSLGEQLKQAQQRTLELDKLYSSSLAKIETIQTKPAPATNTPPSEPVKSRYSTFL